MKRDKYYKSLEKKNVKLECNDGQVCYGYVDEVTLSDYDESGECIFEFS